MHLVIVGGVNNVVEATRKLKSALGDEVCVEIVRSTLKDFVSTHLTS
jgi:hypothetical protein